MFWIDLIKLCPYYPTMPRRRRNPNQQPLPHTRKRPRSKRGRPALPEGKRRVAHRERKRFLRRCVVNVTLRLRDDVPRLRKRIYAVALREAFQKGCFKEGFSICQFSIQGNHLHLICEADNHVALARGMQGFAVRAAKAINRAAGRKGTVFADRYHARRVTNASQLRNVLCYVLNNARKHGRKIRGCDPYSSARYFDGWSRDPKLEPTDCDASPVAPATLSLLKKGWRYHGLIDPDETPKSAQR
jgi:REP element-mobilizing transposase RayT